MKPDDLPARILVEQPRQLAALTSPVRLEILELFGIWGPCAVSEVADQMGRPADSLYYHLRKLVSVGLLEKVGERRSTHRLEAVYRLPAREIEVPRAALTSAGRAMTHKAVDSLLRLAGRELKASLEDQAALDEGPERTLYARRNRARLSKAALRELNRHLTAIEEIFEQAARKKSRAQRTVAVTFVMSPAPKREGA